jgi:MSHA biogenesis protein MshJ
MKQSWNNFAAKIDGLSRRERIFLFAAAIGVLVSGLQIGLLDPLIAKNTSLSQRIVEQNNKVASIDAAMLQKLRAFEVDPDLALRKRLSALKLEPQQLSAELRAMEKSMVAPGKMVPLLESILKANGQLQLVSMKSLARTPLSDMLVSKVASAAPVAAAAPGAAAVSVAVPNAANLIYRHGIEITVQGRYPELLAYLAALDTMQAKLYWGKAELVVDAYPLSRLTFTVYTLSLDQTWIKL